MKKAFYELNQEWKKMGFVAKVTWVDVDDDKLPNSSKTWIHYGMRMTPTKDKKLKPVVHVACAVGTGFIVSLIPDTHDLTLADMMNQVITTLSEGQTASSKALMCFLLDRGYLQLAAPQEDDSMTNLIQIISSHGAKFHGTVKKTVWFICKPLIG